MFFPQQLLRSPSLASLAMPPSSSPPERSTGITSGSFLPCNITPNWNSRPCPACPLDCSPGLNVAQPPRPSSCPIAVPWPYLSSRGLTSTMSPPAPNLSTPCIFLIKILKRPMLTISFPISSRICLLPRTYARRHSPKPPCTFLTWIFCLL